MSSSRALLSRINAKKSVKKDKSIIKTIPVIKLSNNKQELAVFSSLTTAARSLLDLEDVEEKKRKNIIKKKANEIKEVLDTNKKLGKYYWITDV